MPYSGRSVTRAKPLGIGNDSDRYLRGSRFQEPFRHRSSSSNPVKLHCLQTRRVYYWVYRDGAFSRTWGLCQHGLRGHCLSGDTWRAGRGRCTCAATEQSPKRIIMGLILRRRRTCVSGLELKCFIYVAPLRLAFRIQHRYHSSYLSIAEPVPGPTASGPQDVI